MSGGWPAPAKLNLFLHVVGRRDDGFHLLQTVFQFIDLCDELEFHPRDDGRITRSADHDEVEESQDLVVRAAAALRDHCGTGEGVDIHVRKRIPLGGGLGGGSSDAATTLVALNAIWDLGLAADDLARIGLQLGADVPVFVRGRAAWAEGVGERLTPVDPPEDWMLLVYPACRVSTAEVFQHPDLTRNTHPITIRDFLGGAGANDCETVAMALYPEIRAARDWLGRHGPARMTGTGSCVFARFRTGDDARSTLETMPAGWRGFVVRGRNQSPLLDRLAGKAAS